MDPYVKNPWAAANPGPFAESDRVRLLWGVTPVVGIVIEDRGNLGIGGRRLYRVRIEVDDDVSDPIESNWPAEELTLVAKAPKRSSKRSQGERTPRTKTRQEDCLMDPYVKNPWAAANPGRFAEGDRVLVPFSPHPVEGIVTEDLGILSTGRRYYRVRIQVDDVSDPYESMWPVEELTLVAKAPKPSRKRRRS